MEKHDWFWHSMGEHGWFWHCGYRDAMGGLLPDPPDEARHSRHRRDDYFAGYRAGEEDRYPPEEEGDEL